MEIIYLLVSFMRWHGFVEVESHWRNICLPVSFNLLIECSSPVDPPQIKYGFHVGSKEQSAQWNWLDVSSPLQVYSNKVCPMNLWTLILFSFRDLDLIQVCYDITHASCKQQIRPLLSSHQATILKIPVSNHSEELPKGNMKN